ncbi:aconitate hydratase AcnA [Oxyplasma meridianum]|uniref:aconitate hydratase n=1 Tax=Oxyplasma meridianum TaxID=3073602 RepID=A0AAX4NIW1_9ARCH
MESKYQVLRKLRVKNKDFSYYSLKEIDKDNKISKLPISIRVILESLIRNFDGKTVREEDIENLINWNPKKSSDSEIPFTVSRVLMQDFTGVPAVVDLAAMRDKVRDMKKNPEIINPLVPVDLVIDHSVQVDFFGTAESFQENQDKEFERNSERYRFLKWAQKAFKNMRIVPPSVGIVHQVNLEYLGQIVMTKQEGGKNIAYFDSLVGTDSHTTMINGLGIVGWGVGGIEAEAAMLGQPVTFKTPEVVGVNLTGKLKSGVTATDLVLTLTELLRKHDVVGKFVEFFGNGISSLALPDRATLSNMCPEYGATMALFPVDNETLNYLRITGRSEEHIELVEKYLKEQGLFGVEAAASFSEVIDLNLSNVKPSVSGPKLPQQRVDLENIGNSFMKFMEESGEQSETGNRQKQVLLKSAETIIHGKRETLMDGDVVIAAITSCTNTSNPRVMVGAGLLAKKAVELGLKVNPKVKTSLAPGSRVVTEYLEKSGLQDYLNKLGFYLAGYGCTTCIGNSGPLDEGIEKAILENKLNTVAVLSGNRNFEARIHRDVRANYLMSPPLVVAFALAGKITIDLNNEPLGMSTSGKKVYLKDIWPSEDEISAVINRSLDRNMFIEKYSNLDVYNKKWESLEAPEGEIYDWDSKSTYIRRVPFFDTFNPKQVIEVKQIKDARPLLVMGDSVTTDHISPAGAIGKDSPAGKYLIANGIEPKDFNSYGSRRGNHEVMMRGTFANNRIRNLMVEKEGGFTRHYPDGKETTVYDGAVQYMKENVPMVVFAGIEYGTGSSRDWAAKGPLLLGVKAVVAKSYERIHRSNLVGMGVLPLEFNEGDAKSLDIDHTKPVTINVEGPMKPMGKAEMEFTDRAGKKSKTGLTVRLDTPVEVEYFQSGGILNFVLKRFVS